MSISAILKSSRLPNLRIPSSTEQTDRWCLRGGPLWTASYFFCLALISIHLYRNPEYSPDVIHHMGNALLSGDQDISQIHSKVYGEIQKWVPEPARSHLMGIEPGAPVDQNQSRQMRASDSRVFAQFLPFFAIRPLYNLTLRQLSKTRLGLLRSALFISAASYFLLGLLLLSWTQKYASVPVSVILALVTVLSPPITMLGRKATSDALATLVAFTALYLLFETPAITAGLVVLLASIYFRTDFVALAGPALVVSWRRGKIQPWHGVALSALAVGSVLAINHFAGDYGIAMLYFRNFVGTPIAPGEMIVHLSFREYLSAFRSGITQFASSYGLPFALPGIAAFWVSSRARQLLAVSAGYLALHFLLLPNWQERWFGVFYLSLGVTASILIWQKGSSISGTDQGTTTMHAVRFGGAQNEEAVAS
jgi:hypothetical protein